MEHTVSEALEMPHIRWDDTLSLFISIETSMAARRAFLRHQPLPIMELSPSALAYRADLVAPTSHRGPILLDRHHDVVFGHSMLSNHLRLRPGSLVKAICIPDIRDAEYSAFEAHEKGSPPLPSEQITAVACLRRNDLPLKQILTALPFLANIPFVSNLAGLSGTSQYVKNALDNGHLTFAHAAALVPLPPDKQDHWAGEVIANKWKTRDLKERIRGSSERKASADLQSTATKLGETLGTDVKISQHGKGYKVTLEWSQIPELQGLLEHLVRAPDCDESCPTMNRLLSLQFVDAGEFDRLFGHLIIE